MDLTLERCTEAENNELNKLNSAAMVITALC